MRRFQFRFDKLLWHRTVQEELAEQQLARSLGEERQVLAAIADVQASAAVGADALRRELAAPVNGDLFALYRGYASALRAREAALRDRRSALAARVTEERRALRERRREREVVTQLKQQAQARYRREAEREAQKILDEIASGRHHTRTTDGSA
ncbi:MAG TPA: flagellar export protein FliJ [Candidatus Baltobacteraceae bacterium]|nr:flagellar export protein FliJ [Candidatus Baltobacteraceae bacterium]